MRAALIGLGLAAMLLAGCDGGRRAAVDGHVTGTAAAASPAPRSAQAGSAGSATAPAPRAATPLPATQPQTTTPPAAPGTQTAPAGTPPAAATPDPAAALTPLVEFGNGRFLVGFQIAPRAYRTTTAGPFCSIEHDGFTTGIAGDVIGTFTVVVEPSWKEVTSSNCGTWSPTNQMPPGAFGNGRFLVGRQMPPGAYQTVSAAPYCSIGHDGSNTNISDGVGEMLTVVVEPGWGEVTTSNCGTWYLITPTPQEAFGGGRFLVGSQITPGAYQTTSAGLRCSIGHDGSSTNISMGVGGMLTVIVASGWNEVSSSNCGTWYPVTPTLQEAFGSGRFLVGSQIAPGAYQTTSAEQQCSIGHDGVTTAQSGGVGGVLTMVVESGWNEVHSSNCGTWLPR